MLGLDVIECVGTLGVGIAVGPVEAVPVDLPGILRIAQQVVGSAEVGQRLVGAILVVGGIPHVEVAAGEVFPVVRLRVLRVVVVEAGTLVDTVFAQQRRGEACAVVDFPVPGEECRRCEVEHHAGVAHLAVLIAPIGVVLVVVGKPVTLVGGSTLRGALGRVAPGGQRE